MDGLGGSLYEQLLASQKEEVKSINLCIVRDQFVAAQSMDEDAASSDEAVAEEDGPEPLAKSGAFGGSTEASAAGSAASDGEDSEALRLEVKAAFSSAIRSGGLAEAFKAMRAKMPQSPGRKDVLDADRKGCLAKTLEDKRKPEAKLEGLPEGVETLQQLKNMATQRLLKAATEGRLQAALHRSRQVLASGAKEAAPHEGEAEADVAARTRRTLFHGARNAELHEALRKEKQQAFRSRARGAVFGVAPAREQEVAPEASESEKCGRCASLRCTDGDEIAQQMQQAKMSLLAGMANGRLQSTLDRLKEKRLSVQEDGDEISQQMQQAKMTLIEGMATGRLQAALDGFHEKPPSVEEDGDFDRQQARQALLGGLVDGRLQAVLEDVRTEGRAAKEAEREALRQEARATLLGGARCGSLGEGLRQAGLARILPKAKANLLAGASSGRLQSALEEVQKSRQSSEEQEMGREELRQQVRTTLLEGVRSGHLQKLLTKPKQDLKQETESEQLRQEASSTLLEGVRSGLLQEGLMKRKQDLKQEMERERLRQQARSTLLKGVHSGLLQKLLTKPKEELKEEMEREELRQQVRSTLLHALHSGLLQKLAMKRKQDMEHEQLCQQARSTLLEGAHSGLLQKFFSKPAQELKQEEDATASSAGLAEEREPPAVASSNKDSATMNGLRHRVQNMFLEAATRGKLVATLEKESLESLRAEAMRSFLEATVDGVLPMALSRLRTAGPNARPPAAAPAAAEEEAAVEEAPRQRKVRIAPEPAAAAPEVAEAVPKQAKAAAEPEAPVSPKAPERTMERSAGRATLHVPLPSHGDGAAAGSKSPSREARRTKGGSSKPPSREGGRSEGRMQPSPKWHEKPSTPTSPMRTSASDTSLPGLSPVSSKSRFSMRLRAASAAASAMALDLSVSGLDMSLSRAATPQRTPSQQFCLRPCASTGMLQLGKAGGKQAPVFLPALSKSPGGASTPTLPAASWAQPAAAGSRRGPFLEAADWSFGRSAAKWDISRAVF